MNPATDSAADAVVIERTFDAPVPLVWQMWTDPGHFGAWYGPTGAQIPVVRLDVRPGGARLVGMDIETPDGVMHMWLAGEHREVIEHERLVYTEFMSDENGAPLPAHQTGMPEGHPTVTEVTVEFVDAAGRTRVRMTHAGIPAGSPGTPGWEMAFDKLGEHLTGLSRA